MSHIRFSNKAGLFHKVHKSHISTTFLEVVEIRGSNGEIIRALALLPNTVFQKKESDSYEWEINPLKSRYVSVDPYFNGLILDVDLEQQVLGDVLEFEATPCLKPDYLRKSSPYPYFLISNTQPAQPKSARGLISLKPKSVTYSANVATAKSNGKLGFFVDTNGDPISFNPSSPATNATSDEVVENAENMQLTILAKILKDKDFSQPTKIFTIEDSKWLFLVRNFVKGLNTLITGETGTGKTTLVSLIANSKNAEILKLDMGSCNDAVPFLLGQQILTTDNGLTCTEYRESSLTLFLQKAAKPENKEKKFVVLLDEINRSPLNAANILFPLLDDSRTLQNNYNPEAATTTKVVNQNIWFVATANIGSSYTGTSQIDEAFLSRFLKVTLKDLNEDELRQRGLLLGLHPTTSQKVAKIIVASNTLYSKGEISVRLSYRDFQIICEMLLDGYSLKDSMEFLIPEIFDAEDASKVKANISVVVQG